MIPASQAFEKVKRLRQSKWPDRKLTNRLEPECWPVVTPKFNIIPGATVFTIGSCFARNVEEFLVKLGFVVPVLDFAVPLNEKGAGRPNGILNKYTPPSVHWELDWASRAMASGGLTDELLMEPLIKLGEDAWVDLQLVGFKPVTLQRAKERRVEIFDLFKKCFSADVVTITLGLLECWWDAEKKNFIQQAPSMDMLAAYPDRFYYEMLDYGRSLNYLKKSIDLLLASGNANKKVIITTSPVPLGRSFAGKDVIVANTYAKSVLRVISGVVSDEYEQVDYFSSYESVMLTKSKDVWQDDLIHVTDSFVGKIVQHLVTSFVDSASLEVSGRVDRITTGSVAGWAFQKSMPENALSISVSINGVEHAITANRLRPGLKESQVHPTGLCGFLLKLGQGQQLAPSDVVVVKVVGSGAIVPVAATWENQSDDNSVR